jgi:hypothetical protein
MTDMSVCTHGFPIFERCLQCEQRSEDLAVPSAEDQREVPQVVSTT